MSSLIQKVSFKPSEAKSLLEKLRDYLGIQELEIFLSGGESYKGIITEIGTDYINIIHDQYDMIIPLSHVRFLKYHH